MEFNNIEPNEQQSNDAVSADSVQPAVEETAKEESHHTGHHSSHHHHHSSHHHSRHHHHRRHHRHRRSKKKKRNVSPKLFLAFSVFIVNYIYRPNQATDKERKQSWQIFMLTFTRSRLSRLRA